MKHLSPQQFQKAMTFIKEHGRSYEKALVAHLFEDAPLETVLTALAGYQNPDGGFGRALEPDVRLPDSSVIATTVALQQMRSMRVSVDHPLWISAIQYLAKTYDHDKRLWWSVPPNVSDASHAPWWNPQKPGGGSLTLNPRAEIVGFLFDTHLLPEYLPASLRQQLLEEVVRELESRPNDLERHEVQSAVRLVETENLPSEWRVRLMTALNIGLTGAVAHHPDEWGGYTLMPLDVVEWQASVFYSRYADVIPANIEFVIAQQNVDGFWSPAWSWADPRISWATVENDLRSLLTGHYLDRLRRFDAIDTHPRMESV